MNKIVLYNKIIPMIILNILLTAFVLFALFVSALLVKQWRTRNKYTKLLDKYRKEYSVYSDPEPDNVYMLEDYRSLKKRRESDDLIKYSLTHDLMWSEELQEYIKISENIPIEDE